MNVFRRLSVPALILGALFFPAPSAQAEPILVFEAFLDGAQETPPNNSPATGYGTVTLNPAMDHFDVDVTWTGLTAPANAAHIHDAPVGVPGPILFPFVGFPSVTSGHFVQTGFSITPAQLVLLQTGLLYMNIHNVNFPGGEIRGQLTPVPEPTSLILLSTGLFGIARYTRRRLTRQA